MRELMEGKGRKEGRKKGREENGRYVKRSTRLLGLLVAYHATLLLAIPVSQLPFWAAAPKRTKSCGTQGTFVHPFVHSSPPGPFRPEICRIRPEIPSLRPEICPLRP